jgi:hypothetical protein
MSVKATERNSKENDSAAHTKQQNSSSSRAQASRNVAASMLSLQRTHGNRFVSGLINTMPRPRGLEARPDWLNVSDTHAASTNDAKFAWQVNASGLPCDCNDIRWEQFVKGGFTIHDERASRSYKACDIMQKINPKSRRFGEWCDDILPDMLPGPRPLNTYPDAHCSCAGYSFDDAPGFGNDFGDDVNGMTFLGITWDTGFEHKIYCADRSDPIETKTFSLAGDKLNSGIDTRKIKT